MKRKRLSNKESKPKTRAYSYHVINPVSGLDLTRNIWAETLSQAKELAKGRARLFGPSTILLEVKPAY